LEDSREPGPWSVFRSVGACRRARALEREEEDEEGHLGGQDGREEQQLEPWHCSEVVVKLEHVEGSGPWSGWRTRRDRGPRWA
jgi:hypothetical protein